MLRRREILALLAAAGAAPALAWPKAEKVLPRLPWRDFVDTPEYRRFVDAIRRMKAKRDAKSPDSWGFWANIHQAHCPHGSDYFLAWHRGYTHLFERKLRELMRSDSFRLPYWNWFNDPDLPQEVTRGDAASNPLWSDRKASHVRGAIAYGAFASKVTGFSRSSGTASFEAQIEACHNNVHNLVGGWMASMQSPQDVLFWLHHANIDRLWTAWIAAGQGRAMPAPGQPYWQGGFDYAPRLALERARATACETLGYRYDDLALPFPEPMVGAAPTYEPPPPPPPPAAAPPPVMAPPPPAAAPPPAPIPMRAVFLDEDRLETRLAIRRRPPMVQAMPGMAPQPQGIAVVLDALSLTDAGAEGGYFYNIYLNLDEGGWDEEDRLIGSIGPFQVAAARNHAHGGEARIVLPAADVVARLAPGRALRDLSVSFVRVDADGAPRGRTIAIGSLTIEE